MQIFQTIRWIFDQAWPPKSAFSVDQIPDLEGRILIVTGGYAGIGKETTKALLNRNAKVYIASRNQDKASKAIRELKESTGREALFLHLDLASLASVRKAAAEFLEKEKKLHVLFNNAGVMICPIDLLTEDGYDLQFGTNVLGHWYFTELLMPALLQGKESSPDHYARIITLSSSTAYFTTLHWDTFEDTPARKKLGKHLLYAQSKFANAVIAIETARRYGDQNILSIALNPGNISSDLMRHTSRAELLFLNLILQPTAKGALTQLYVGTMPDALNHNGEFYVPWARLGKCRKEAYDPEIGRRLWDWMEEQVKKH